MLAGISSLTIIQRTTVRISGSYIEKCPFRMQPFPPLSLANECRSRVDPQQTTPIGHCVTRWFRLPSHCQHRQRGGKPEEGVLQVFISNAASIALIGSSNPAFSAAGHESNSTQRRK